MGVGRKDNCKEGKERKKRKRRKERTKKKMPTEGLEPSTTTLRALRSTD